MVVKESSRNYYQLLGVAQDAAPDVVRDAYRALVDDFGERRGATGALAPLDEQRLADINAAYIVLSNADSRAEYDALLAENLASAKTGIGYGSPIGGIFAAYEKAATVRLIGVLTALYTSLVYFKRRGPFRIGLIEGFIIAAGVTIALTIWRRRRRKR